jgi:predicted nucleotidyltransferase
MVDASVVSTVQRYLKNLVDAGIPVRFGVVFGSHATGRVSEWSDIDLLVISDRFDGQKRREDVNTLWRVAARTDPRIEPVPSGERQFEEDPAGAIIEVARREGQKVTLPE